MLRPIASLVFLFGFALPAEATEPVQELADAINFVWIAVAAALVLLMQLGFMLLEGGTARSRHSINVAQKNLADFALSVSLFFLLGFSLMFGTSLSGWIGFSFEFLALPEVSTDTAIFFLFQAMFCGTAATILSGALAERFSYVAYLATVALIALVIYPVFGHWAWGSLLLPDQSGFLESIGFVDFAGSTVVHSVGAWVALAGIIAVGPRIGRFNKDGSPVYLNGHSALLSSAGAFLLFVGWMGFNAGSTLAAGRDIGPILLNTVVSAVLGAVAGMIVGQTLDNKFMPHRMINGLLGGLVAITAGCAIVSPPMAACLGIVGAVVATYGESLLERLGLDDVVGAVPVHGFAGVVGTVGLAFVAPMDSLPADSRLSQIAVQFAGVAVAFLWVFPVSFVWFRVLNSITPIRVSEEDERIGLNSAEHGVTLGTGAVQALLADLLRTDIQPGQRLKIEPGDEAGELMELFNRLLVQIEATSAAKDHIEAELHAAHARSDEREAAAIERWRSDRDMERRIIHEILTIVDAVAAGELDRRADLTKRATYLARLGDGINALLDHLSNMVRSVSEGAEALSHQSRTQKEISTELRSVSSEQSARVGEATQQISDISETGQDMVMKAREGLSVTENVAAMARKGSTDAEQSVKAMEDIRQRSMRIAEIIEMIDEVASKTNLLAINASVEAARAGAHGHGFAIVAEEVRALSRSTADLALEIKQSVAATTGSIESGIEIISSTTGTLDDIRIAANNAEISMREIETAIDRQASKAAGLALTLDAIEKLSATTRSASEQSAGSAESLSQQTQRLANAAAEYRSMAELGAESDGYDERLQLEQEIFGEVAKAG